MPHKLDEGWQLLEDFADAVQLLHQDVEQGNVLPAVCDLAVKITSADHASVCTAGWGAFRTVAATSEAAGRADALLRLADAAVSRATVAAPSAHMVGDLASDAGWPEVGPRIANKLGIHSLLSLVLPVDGETVSAITVYSARPQAFTARHEAVLQILAVITAATLRADHHEDRAASLEHALRTSRRIGIALGVLITLCHVTVDDAWELLSRESMNRNIKVSTLAEHLIATGTFDPPPSG